MKLTTLGQGSNPRLQRRTTKGNSYKKILNLRTQNSVKREPRDIPFCDISDDSGLGIENNTDSGNNRNTSLPHPSIFRFATAQKRASDELYSSMVVKRHRSDPEEENFDAYSQSSASIPFVDSDEDESCAPSVSTSPFGSPARGNKKAISNSKRSNGGLTLYSQLSHTSKHGRTQLVILNQPEQQHRARYQTEGSRGAIKDRTGNNFPTVKLEGYNRSTMLQVFIGSDQGRVMPHMFYQACRVTGKNSTPCLEKAVAGTVVIEIELDPAKNMTVTCDCIGILKERNVDVEHRFPDEGSARNKKKSTRCRLIFRTNVRNDDGTVETLQIASQAIACTQPPGVPEISKKSLSSCPVNGGKELFILGKNFSKDTHVRFQVGDWQQTVNPEKEHFQQSHLVCVIPAYKCLDTKEPVIAKVTVVSGNRNSEPHNFMYTPIVNIPTFDAPVQSTTVQTNTVSTNTEIADIPDCSQGYYKLNGSPSATRKTSIDLHEEVNPVITWQGSNLSSPTNGNCSLIQNDSEMMPPPAMLPRRSSVQMIVPESLQSLNADVNRSSNNVVSYTDRNSGCSELSSSATQSQFLLNQYPQVSSISPISSFSNFCPMTDLSLKSEPIEKIEPVSEPVILPCTDSYSLPQNSATQSGHMYPDSNSVLLSTETSEVYPSSQNYIYPTSDTYPHSIPESHAENQPSVEEMKNFSQTKSSFHSLNSINMVSNTTDPSSLHMNSFGTKHKTESWQAKKWIHAATNSKIRKTSALSSSVFESNKIKQMQKMERIKKANQRQQFWVKQGSCYATQKEIYLKQLQEMNFPSMTQQDYLNKNNTNHQATKNLMPVNDDTAYKKISGRKPVSSLNVSEAELVLENSNPPLTNLEVNMLGKSSQAQANFTSALTISNAYSAESANNQNTYLNPLPSTIVLNEFAESHFVDDSINTVPKLEELVNSAADSHMQTDRQCAPPLNLINGPGVTNSNCIHDGNSALDLFLAGTQQIMSAESCIPQNSSLLQEPVVFPQAANVIENTVISEQSLIKDEDIKEEKPSDDPEISKKTEEGMFSSEISRMTEHDLLSYINPSCFDQV